MQSHETYQRRVQSILEGKSGSGASMTMAQTADLSAADTVWMLLATALVLLMTPALGFFYGGWFAQRTRSTRS
jgi:hypothetical protein